MPRALRSDPEGADPRVFRALADPTRRRILHRIGDGEMRASDIAAGFDVSRPSISRHLRVLREARLVRARKVGREVHYAIQPGPLRDAAARIRALDALWGEALVGLGQHLDRRQRSMASGPRRPARRIDVDSPA